MDYPIKKVAICVVQSALLSDFWIYGSVGYCRCTTFYEGRYVLLLQSTANQACSEIMEPFT